ncbi:hypothetical protein L218DRAFT_936093 [Marasmius fiardii PR-910]|nr:hypothetical protein L218DRAFT_936093 [Marasmius fiardii PR-910]
MSTDSVAAQAVESYIAGIKSSIDELFFGTVWAAVLIPLLGMLFLLSTPTTRRMPIFLMNVLAVTMGIVTGIMNFRIYIWRIYYPFIHDPMGKSLQIAYMAMIFFLPILMDCILAYRLTAVFPRRITPDRILVIIFVPILLLKIARLTNGLAFMIAFGTGDWSGRLFQTLWDHRPYVKIEWILQVIDNCYTSSLFLWQLWACQSRQKGSGCHFVVEQASTTTRRVNTLKHLFYLALSSFVFPCLISIVQVSIAFHNHNYNLASYLFIVNLYFEIICVLFATIWAIQTRAERESQQNKSHGGTLSAIVYRSGDIHSTNDINITRPTDVTTTSGTVELSDIDEAKV